MAAIAILFAWTTAHAQQDPGETALLNRLDSLSALNNPPAAVQEPAAEKPAASDGNLPPGVTEITASKEATFDDKARRAIFVGNVKVVDPEFTLNADQLTVFLKGRKPDPNAGGAPEGAKTGDGPGGGGGIEKAVAEGNVTIVQDKPGENGGEPLRYVGRGRKAVYDAVTGDMTLSGWPQVQQGINAHVATEESTVIVLNRDGKMKTYGRSRTMIQDKDSADRK